MAINSPSFTFVTTKLSFNNEMELNMPIERSLSGKSKKLFSNTNHLTNKHVKLERIIHVSRIFFFSFFFSPFLFGKLKFNIVVVHHFK